jgi:hypothetical protein
VDVVGDEPVDDREGVADAPAHVERQGDLAALPDAVGDERANR